MKYLITLLLFALSYTVFSQGYGETYSKSQRDSIKLARQFEKQLKINPGLYKSDILLEKAGGSGQTAFACYAISSLILTAGMIQLDNATKNDEKFDIQPYYYASAGISAIGIILNIRAWSLLKRAGIESRKEKQLLLKTNGNGLALVYKF